jgi:hypothetical protein
VNGPLPRRIDARHRISAGARERFARVFDRLVQVDDSAIRVVECSGIGLTAVRLPRSGGLVSAGFAPA